MSEIITQAIEHCISLASNHFRAQFSIPSFSFQQRGKIAGSARLHEWTIRLNPVLFAANQVQFIQEVIPHEVAHLIVFKQWEKQYRSGKIKPHGAEWQYVMQRVFNLAARTTHSMDVSAVRGEVFAYECLCQSHSLSIRRHRAVTRGTTQYLCRKCGSVLKQRSV